ncbi:sulfotransferase domain-containing protein [Palleronia rufa]|uniref:sulfotransferase domain-containing protein n=1 Tax=Palleronia rufa TaxID=1530186 RepID=UPI00055A2147|nr:sulfotransferase domain-containing protein [Palleronia rufa]
MKSVIAVSMHKAGSSIADLIVTDFLREKGYRIDRVALRVMESPLQEPEFFAQYAPNMTPQDTYFGMARHPGTHDLDMFDRYRVVSQMRDPRDCIVSAYFSFRQSHIMPTDISKAQEFAAQRSRLATKDIDTYAMEAAPKYLARCTKMRRILTDCPDVLALTYESMVLDTEAWLNRMAEFVDQPLTEPLRARLGGKIHFAVDSEDPKRHKRQVRPGDHRRKLRPETIEAIDDILKPELDFFGYAC